MHLPSKHWAYYNDNDKNCTAWLRELMKDGLITEGEIDERSITEVSADDVRGFRRVHFFAGVGGFDHAMRLAGIRDDEPVWSGSCPCPPPFSSAGKKKSCPRCQGVSPLPCPRRTGFFLCCDCGHAWFADARHLWPEFWRLISQCRPPVVYGEQVASDDGRGWLAGVRASLEILGYAVIHALRASGRPISDKGFTGWPTPLVNDELGSTHCYGPKTTDGSERKRYLKLPGAAMTVGWPSPTVRDLKGREGQVSKDGRRSVLAEVVHVAGWPTPMAGSPATENYNEAGDTCSSRKTKILAGWATPTSRDHKDGTSEGTAPTNGLLGRQVWSSPAQTGNRGALNPRFSLWLMGFPAEWASCGERATASTRGSRKNSSKPTAKPKMLEVDW